MEGQQKEQVKLVTLGDVEEANKNLTRLGLARRTPVLRNCERFYAPLSQHAAAIHFKLDGLQTCGCFKTRGLTNLLYRLQRDDPSALKGGLVTMSAGNFGRAMAWAAQKMKIPAIVFMPEEVPVDRIATIRGLGAEVRLKPRVRLQEFVDELVKEKAEQGTPIFYAHPFDDLNLIAGHGTCGLEVVEDIPDVEVIITGVGGGGYISGIAVAAKGKLGDKVKIVGVEPEGAPKMSQSMKEGRPIRLQKVDTIVAGLAAPFAGKNAFEHVKRYVEEVVCVSDEEVVKAMKIYYDEFKMVVEPAGAAGLAALLSGKLDKYTKGKKICIVISGGNVGVDEIQKRLSVPQTSNL